MTLKQLATRLGFSVPAAKNFEMREVDEAITLASLRKIANAMEMDLVYYFKPKQDSLDDLLQIRAELKAKELMESSNQAMLLENQEADNKNKSREYDRLITEIRNQKLSSLWD
jgi:predicted DNA-binding mobile mystery protein A